MNVNLHKDRRVFEIMLIVVAFGMTAMLYRLGPYKMVALNFFFLPIVLCGYFLGRTSAGILALLCALSVTIVMTVDSSGLATFTSPIMVGLAITVWAAVLGLTAILVGTLCDERAKTLEELHDAYVGVVEVLSKYLQSADPGVKARSTRIAHLCETVAVEMKLSRKQIDDVRVGALLHNLGNVEITTQVISKAVDTLEADPVRVSKHTFLGVDLVRSLGSVLSGAVPLLAGQDDAVRECLMTQDNPQSSAVPLGAKIIRAVRAYDALSADDAGERITRPQEALDELRRDSSAGHDPGVLDAVERVLNRLPQRSSPEPVLS